MESDHILKISTKSPSFQFLIVCVIEDRVFVSTIRTNSNLENDV